MRRFARVIVGLVILLDLTACYVPDPTQSRQIKELQGQVQRLQGEKRQLEIQIEVEREETVREAARTQGKYEASHRYHQRAAAAAEACDWLIPLCSQSMTAGGRKALSQGYAADPSIYWLLIACQFAIAILLLLTCTTAVFTSYKRHVMPLDTAIEQAATAHAALEETQAEHAALKHACEKLGEEEDALRARLEETEREAAVAASRQQAQLDALTHAIGHARDELRSLQSETEATREAKVSSLSAFFC